MGKQGPCCHCGTTSTPLWRNGPPGKPVLCNACGSRWRTKGTLINYTPIHARAFASLDSDDSLNSQEEKLSFKTNRRNWHIKVHNGSSMEDEYLFAAYNPCLTGFEDDTSNKSSSGSAISVSESCVQLGSTDGNDISGPLQSSVFDFHIPSRKRSRIIRHSPATPASPVERLRRDLLNILQEQESSHQSGISEEELIFEREDLAYSFEMGLGSILLKPPISFTEDEFEASSPVVETKALHLDKSAGLNWDIEDINELEGNSKKQRVFTNKYLGNTNLGDPDNSLTCSPQICATTNMINNERYKPGSEISSCPSHLVGGDMSVPAKRPPHLTYFQTCRGMSSDIIRTCKRQKEHLEVTQWPSSSTRCLPVFCQSISSNILSSVNAVQLEPLDLDVQLGVSADAFCPLEGLAYLLSPKEE